MLHDMPTVNISIGDKAYKLYVASSEEEKQRGLSGVKNLLPHEGMIFPYDNDRPRTFQFRETLLPLKVYFIGSNGKVIQCSSAKPRQKKNISCNIPCRWVIEVLDGDS